MDAINNDLISIVARHGALNKLHQWLLSFHGVWAVLCWLLFIAQWVRSKGTSSHKLIGKFILYAFLIPLELTGLILCPYLFFNIKRDNILLSSGHLVVPSMGLLFVMTTYRAFKSLQYRSLNIIMTYIGIIVLFLQTIGTSILSYKLLCKVDTGMEHENNLELFLLTTPFTLIELYLSIKNYRFGHVLYIKYLTLQMFPGSMIVLARDSYWIWGNHGIADVRLRILMENSLMVPLYYSIYRTLAEKKFERTNRPVHRNKIHRKNLTACINVKQCKQLRDYCKHLF